MVEIRHGILVRFERVPDDLEVKSGLRKTTQDQSRYVRRVRRGSEITDKKGVRKTQGANI